MGRVIACQAVIAAMVAMTMSSEAWGQTPPPTQQQSQAAQWIQRGDQLLNSGANQQAVEAYAEARQLDRTNAAVYIGAGIAQYRMGKYIMSQFEFQTGLRYNPNNQTLQTNLEIATQALNGQIRQNELLRQQNEADSRASQSNAVVDALNGFAAGYAAGAAANRRSPPVVQQPPAGGQSYAPQRQANAAPYRPPPTSTYSEPGGQNSCAEMIGGVIRNHCNYPIDVVIAGKSGAGSIFLGAGLSNAPGPDYRIVLSCNQSMTEHHGAQRSGNGWVCV